MDALIYRKEPCTIYGIDISEDMVKLASEKNQKGIANGDIHFAVGDVSLRDYRTIGNLYYSCAEQENPILGKVQHS